MRAPWRVSRNCSTETSQPNIRRRSVRRPKIRPPGPDSSTFPTMRWAISGGAGFLGLHLARRLLADGHEVRTLDLAPLDDTELERSVEELRGDVRDPGAAARLVDGADVLVHAAAALPIQASRGSIRSVTVDGPAR